MTSTGFGGRFLARVLLLAPLVGAACNPDSGDVGARRSALDIQSGTVTGSLTWGGAPVTGMAASTLKVRDSGLVWQTTVAPATGTLVPVVVPAGLYEVAIETSTTCERTAVDAVDVLPGATAVIATDLTASFGRVVASTILNGAPYDAKLRIFSSCSTEFTTGADGLVASLLTEGTYTARITLADSSLFQERTFTVVAGQTTDLGVVSFSGGTIRGTVRRNGTPLQNPQFLHQIRAVGIPGTTNVRQDGTYTVPGIHAPGTYTVALYPSSCTSSPLTERTVTVAAGPQTEVDFDVGPLMSLVTGRVMVDGAAPEVFSTSVGSNACYPLSLAGDGQFSGYLPPGNYGGFVRTNNAQLATFPIAVAPGAAPVDVGTIAIQSGTVQGNVTWNGSSFAEASVRLSATSTNPALGVASVDDQGHYALLDTLAGDRTVGLSPSCGQQIVERVVSVGAGATATADFDVTSLLGRVTANVTFDGVPALGSYDVDLFPDGCSMWNVFDRGLLLPGPHTATIRSFVDNRRHVVTFDVVAGQTTDLGVIDVPLNAGTVGGTVVWKGAPVSTIGEYFKMRLLLDQDGVRKERLANVSEDGRFHFDDVPIGNYELSLMVTNAGFVLESQRVFVAANSTITRVFDLTLTHGRATGTLKVNGGANYKLLFDWPNPYHPFPGGGDGGMSEGRLLNHDAQGRFAAYFEHRSSSLSIFLPGQSTLPDSSPFVRVPLSITTGHTVDVDGQSTEPGSDVTVMLNGDALYEDVGAIRIIFTTVMRPGSTTVVATDTGPPLPAGYQVSSRYWNLDTTALYAGDIHICIHYDPAEVTGPESALELLHDVNGWDNIRIDLGTDVEKNVICGTTTSFSPFVLAIPPNTPPIVNVPAALTVEAKGPAGASVTFVASATDAQTGPLAATCVPPSGSTFPIGTTTVTCSAKDSGGLSGAASFAVTVRDSVGPVPVVPATVVAYATTTAGAKVTYAKPTATDAVDGARPTTCAPASGSTFKPGKTTVTCTAADSRGNAGSASFTVWVQYQAPTDGNFFLFPVRPNGTSIFRIGRPVPVRFKLTGASAGITNLTAKLVVTKISNVVQGTTEDTSDETQDDTDFLFKYRPLLLKWYAYRWKTRGETQGTYRLTADLGDGVTHQVTVSLR